MESVMFFIDGVDSHFRNPALAELTYIFKNGIGAHISQVVNSVIKKGRNIMAKDSMEMTLYYRENEERIENPAPHNSPKCFSLDLIIQNKLK